MSHILRYRGLTFFLNLSKIIQVALIIKSNGSINYIYDWSTLRSLPYKLIDIEDAKNTPLQIVLFVFVFSKLCYLPYMYYHIISLHNTYIKI